MGLADQFEGLKGMGDVVLLHGRDVILSLFFLLLGLLVAKIAVRYLRRLLERFMANKALVATICNTIFVLVAVIAFVVALEQAGARSEVINRILVGAALLIIAGIFLLRPLFPSLPFKVGHMVQIAGLVGKVENIALFITRIKSYDGKTYFIPNHKILKETIINYHFTPERRITLSVAIRYSDDLIKAKKIITETMKSDSRVLQKPAPKTYVVNLGDNGVELSARCWVENPKFWSVRCDLLEKIKLRLDGEGIAIAISQRDVHLYGLAPVLEKQTELRDIETI